MLHHLRRHPFPVVAHFDFTVAVTFSVDPQVLQDRLMPGLALDLYHGRAFVAIALVQTRALRPAGFPTLLGKDFLLAGYRIFVRHRGSDGRLRRGLQVLRSDADSRLLCGSGNLMTHYNYAFVQTEVTRDESGMRVVVRGNDPLSELEIAVNFAHPSLPEGSIFPDLRTARRFAGPMPFTFSFEEETGKVVSVEGKRANWHPRLVGVDVRRSGFLDSFAAADRPRIAAGFFVEQIDYRWERGVVWEQERAEASTPVEAPHKTTPPRPRVLGRKPRHRLAGTLNIVRFNWPSFVLAGAVTAAGTAFAANPRVPIWLRWLGALAGAGALGQTAISLAASHSVYDRSQFRNSEWLVELLHGTKRVLDVHSGFDETSEDLRARLAGCEVVAVDLYDPNRMPEPSIRRARATYPPPEGTLVAQPEAFPFRDETFDATLLIFAAHEWRETADRTALFGEIARVLRPGGRLIVAEHVRDAANFAAFGPGFLHFLPTAVWRSEPARVLELRKESRPHPLVRVFEFHKNFA